MADEETDLQPKESKFDFKIIIIGVVIFLIALGASYFVLRSVFSPLMPKETAGGGKEVTHGTLFDAGEFITNIDDDSGTRYMKVTVSLELDPNNKKAAEECTTYKPIIRDCILTLIQSKTLADFDPRNRDNVKQEIIKIINDKLGSKMVTNVYFEDIVIQ